jgi:D-ribose pyranase
MKKAGILNPDLAYGLATLGHTQTVFIVDAGMPLPAGGPIVDLALTAGIPRFVDVLAAVLNEIVVESSMSAQEAGGTNVEQWFSDHGLSPEPVPHEYLKNMLEDASLIIRTGETTPYANIALFCGVPF